MTYQYGGTLWGCWDKFSKSLNLNDDIIKKEIYILFKDFYNFIAETSDLLEKNPSIINPKLMENNYKIETNDAKFDLTYHKTLKSQISISYKGRRITKNELKLTEELDLNKLKLASRANYIHIQDSSVVRYCISVHPMIAIHDCFSIDWLSVTYLISLTNEAMNKEYHNLKLNDKKFNIFSIFILL